MRGHAKGWVVEGMVDAGEDGHLCQPPDVLTVPEVQMEPGGLLDCLAQVLGDLAYLGEPKVCPCMCQGE